MEEMRLADERLNVLEHPLIAHKMSIMRDASTAPSQFRQLVHEVAMLEVYEALRDLATVSNSKAKNVCPPRTSAAAESRKSFRNGGRRQV